MNKENEKNLRRINEIKKQLQAIGPMMIGNISKQQRKDTNGKMYGEYWKLGYTHQMKSRSHYVPDVLVAKIQEQNSEYRKFKKLTEEWIKLAIIVAVKELDQAKKKIKN